MKKRIFSVIVLLVMAAAVSLISDDFGIAKAAKCSLDSNIPNLTFRGYLKEFDKNNNGSLEDDEIAKIKSIDVSGMGISTFEGVEYLTALEEFKADNNSSSLSSIDLTKNVNLKYVSCNNCKNLTTLKLPSGIKGLECSGTQAGKNLNLEGFTSLETLKLKGSGRPSVDVSKLSELQVLDVSDNTINSLSVSNNPELVFLNCTNTNISELDLSSNKKLQKLICSDNKISTLDLTNNKGLSEIYCKGNSIKVLELGACKSLAYLSCYGNPLTKLELSETAMEKGLNNGKLCVLTGDSDAVANEGVSITSGTERSDYYTGGSVKIISLEDVSVIGIITYNNTELKVTCVGYEAGDVKAPADCEHIFRDYKHKIPMAETSIRVYGNAVTVKNKDGKKVNRKTAVLYTDIKPSYIYTEKNGKVTAKTGKVVVGITMTNEKPVVTKKNKIEDAQAAEIAKATIKSGMITITAKGKGAGVVYLWVIDTGADGDYTVCPINVAMAPKKMQAKDKPYEEASGTILKNPKFDAGTKLNIFLNPIGGDEKVTGACTYTVELDAKSQKLAEIAENTEGEYGYTITSKDASLKKKSKITLKITCDQTGKSFKWYATIMPVKEAPAVVAETE